MKTKQTTTKTTIRTHCIIFALLLSAGIGTSRANFNGSDNFNASSEDLTKWGADIVTGSGTLTQTSGVLQYTASGSSNPESSFRPWIANSGSFTSNWAVQIDVNMPTLALTAGQRYEFGLQISNGDDPTDTFTLKLRVDAASGRQFHSQLRVNGVAQAAVTSTTTSTSAAILIQYDAATTTLSAGYDANGAVGGYNFTIFDSRNITTAGWNMTASSVFDVAVVGTSQGGLAISSANNVSGDNFLAVPEPSTWAMLSLGFMLLLAWMRWQRRLT